MFKPKYRLLLGLIIFLPLISQAGLVPCSGTDCTACDLFLLAQNVFKFVLETIFLVVTLIIVVGAIYFLTAGGDEKKVKTGKTIIRNALLGLAIALCSWLIVNTILYFLSGGEPGEWWKIQC